MYRGNSSRIIPVVLVLIVMVIAIVALVSVGRSIFGGSDQSSQQADVGRQSLLNTGFDHSVRMTVRGAIVADENFRSYQITISPAARSLAVYSGYLSQQINMLPYGNNVKAYEAFVYALDKANMMSGSELKDEKDDTRGVCATGKMYEFEVLQNNNIVKRLWTSTCKGSPGSFRASTSQVQNLFLNQIPDNKKTLGGIDS